MSTATMTEAEQAAIADAIQQLEDCVSLARGCELLDDCGVTRTKAPERGGPPSAWRWFNDPERGRALSGPSGETIAAGEHGEVWIQDATGDIASIAAEGLRTYLLGSGDPRVTQRQLDMMRHATGHSVDGERNYYAVPPDSPGEHDWSELVSMGLAIKSERGDGAAHAIVSDDITYHVTEAGFRMTYGAERKPRKRANR